MPDGSGGEDLAAWKARRIAQIALNRARGAGSTVTGTLPIVVTLGNVSINPATDATAGSLSAADKTKLDNIVSVTGTGYAHFTGGIADGVAQDFISVGTTLGGGFFPALTGLIRLPNSGVAGPSASTAIAFRNANNTADVNLAVLDDGNVLYLGSEVIGATGAAIVHLQASGILNFDVGGVTPLQLLATNIEPNVDVLGFPERIATYGVVRQVFDGATFNAILSGQRPGAGAVTHTTSGSAQLAVVQLASATPQTLVEAAEPTQGNMIVGLCGLGTGLTSTQCPAGAGSGVIWIAEAAVKPTAATVSGAQLYVASGRVTSHPTGQLGVTEHMVPDPTVVGSGADIIKPNQTTLSFLVLATTVNAGAVTVDTGYAVGNQHSARLGAQYVLTDRTNQVSSSASGLGTMQNYGAAAISGTPVFGTNVTGDAALATGVPSFTVSGGTLRVTFTPPAAYAGHIDWELSLAILEN